MLALSIPDGRCPRKTSIKTESALMEEDRIIIETNIAHYTALSQLDLDDEKRAADASLHAIARTDLARAMAPKNSMPRS
jgi:hypothetical protein